jgi:hypothetical protein
MIGQGILLGLDVIVLLGMEYGFWENWSSVVASSESERDSDMDLRLRVVTSERGFTYDTHGGAEMNQFTVMSAGGNLINLTPTCLINW